MKAYAPFSLGTGSRALFWHDIWVGDVPLERSFHLLFSISSFPNGSISVFWESQCLVQSIIFRQLPKYEKIVDFNGLLEILTVDLFSTLWEYKGPKRVNILYWIL